MLGNFNIQFLDRQRSSAGVSQSRKERCAGRLTSGKAVDWDGRAGPGARADGGSAAGARAGGSAAGARAGGSCCSRASWNSSPFGSAAAASSGTGPAPSAAASPAAGGAAAEEIGRAHV